VQYALRNATAGDSRGGPDLFIVGPTVDGEPLTVIARIDGDTLYVSNVTL
jgi:hypothetical protein